MCPFGLRGGFSDRRGYSDINHTIQTEELDERSRIALFNSLMKLLEVLRSIERYRVEGYLVNLFCDVFLLDHMTARNWAHNYSLACEKIKKVFFEGQFFSIFDIIEHFVTYNWENEISSSTTDEPFRKISAYASARFNRVFEKECIGYRLINKQITDITSPEELQSISEASASKYAGASNHIKKAIDLLYNREKPDYANSIKESISAIEAVCQVIAGDPSATLGQALKLIKDKVAIHPALADAINKIYGYTSDASGIRHASGMDGPSATFDEAKFMLVACSAFLNYLIGIYK